MNYKNNPVYVKLNGLFVEKCVFLSCIPRFLEVCLCCAEVHLQTFKCHGLLAW
jgi:hypothetical protein